MILTAVPKVTRRLLITLHKLGLVSRDAVILFTMVNSQQEKFAERQAENLKGRNKL